MTITRAPADHAAAPLERARALAHAISETAPFRAFEAAQEALDADPNLVTRLSGLQMREQELRRSRAWGGAHPEEVRAIEREWEDLAGNALVAAHLATREELIGLLREVTAEISEGVGLDYGAVCAPAGGCC